VVILAADGTGMKNRKARPLGGRRKVVREMLQKIAATAEPGK
jgi:hypothetical protein